MREFLLFIVERTIEGRTQDLTEQMIGCEVFGRSPGYNHAEDNIVRVSARQLRSKLKAYFESDGLTEEFILEVPKGAYVPEFKPLLPGSTPPSAISRRHLVWVAAAALATAVIAAVFVCWLWRENKILKAASAANTGSTLVGELLLASNKPVTVVIADFGLVMMGNLTGHAVSLEDYVNQDYLRGSPRDKEPALHGVWRTLATRQITNFDDVTLVSRLLKAHPDHRDQIAVRHARSMNVRDFKAGQFLIQGGSLSTPWVTLFNQRLNFQFSWPESGHAFVHNLRPRSGEQSVYGPVLSRAGAATSYARIALVQNLSGTGKVLLVAGCNIAGNEAAAEFLLSPSSVPLVKHTLGLSNLSQAGYFEILLETSTLDGVGRGSRIVAFRR